MVSKSNIGSLSNHKNFTSRSNVKSKEVIDIVNQMETSKAPVGFKGIEMYKFNADNWDLAKK